MQEAKKSRNSGSKAIQEFRKQRNPGIQQANEARNSAREAKGSKPGIQEAKEIARNSGSRRNSQEFRNQKKAGNSLRKQRKTEIQEARNSGSTPPPPQKFRKQRTPGI